MLNNATLINTGSSLNLASERRRISGRRFSGEEGRQPEIRLGSQVS